MSCAKSLNEYQGDGSTTDFPITFEYQQQSEIIVALLNNATETYSALTVYKSGVSAGKYYKWMNATTIRIVDESNTPYAPPAGVTNSDTGAVFKSVLIFRLTPADPLKATFFPGSSIRAEDLNTNFEQLAFAIDELTCSVERGQIYADETFWDKRSPDTVRSADTYVVDDATIATTKAIESWADDRYLNDMGAIIGGPAIDVTEASNQVEIAVDIQGDAGLDYFGSPANDSKLGVKPGNGITTSSDGVNVGQGTGITVNTNDVAVKQVNIWGRPHDHGTDVSGDMAGVGNIVFNSAPELNTTDNSDITIEANGSGELDINRNTTIDGTLNVKENADFDKNVNIDGNLGVTGSLSFSSLSLTGDLVVEGNTTLGDDASADTVTINADTTLNSGSTLQIDSTSTSDNTFIKINAPAEFQSSGGAAGHNQTYTLPVKAPTNNQVLTSQSDGTLSWGPGGGGSGGAIQDLSLNTAADDTVGILISDGGTGVTIPAAENKTGGAGVMTKTQVQKLN